MEMFLEVFSADCCTDLFVNYELANQVNKSYTKILRTKKNP